MNHVIKSAEVLHTHSRNPPTIVWKNPAENTILAKTLPAKEKH